MNPIEFLIANRADLAALAFEHLSLVVIATGAATVAGVPTGVLLTRRAKFARPVLAVANVLQTIPSLALFGFLIPVLGSYGIGRAPAIVALFLYSLLPIIRNTFTGIQSVDPAVREAARGMGMTDWQVLRLVELPLALGVMVAGIRVAAVIAVGTATIAAAIGAGGLGTYIFRGLRQNDNTLILAGAIPAALMALAADFALGWSERSLAPEASPARVRAAKIAAAGLAVLFVAGLLLTGKSASSTDRITVGSKDFTESVILAEIVAQTIEQSGIEVERTFELGGDLCHRAMVEGTVDCYVEYTGTSYTSILKHKPVTDPRVVFDTVRSEYGSRFGFDVLDPLGFENTFAILVRGDDARRYGLRTVSDAARLAPEWRAGFGQDFMSREDGYPGFSKTYGLKFAEPPREMDLALTYRALAGKQVDLIAGNSTDGLIDKLDLVQLEDDKRYFPPYEATIVIRSGTLVRFPAAARSLRDLAGSIASEDMRRLNFAVDAEGQSPRDVVRAFLESKSRE